MRLRESLVEGAVAGATAGLLAQVLVMRLNPEVSPTLRTVLFGAPLWSTWGAFMLGIPFALALLVFRRLRPPEDPEKAWSLPALLVAVFGLAAVLSRLNADLHPEYLTGSGPRTLEQDAVAWLVAALLAAGAGRLVRRFGGSAVLKTLYVVFVFALPLSRFVGQPTPLGKPQIVALKPLGQPSGSLVVCGVQGLDSKVLLTYATGERYQNIDVLRTLGAWGPYHPFRPSLHRAHWTAVATGTLPRRNGVKSRRGWRIPMLFDETLRLLPWTPQGSRLILPWGLAQEVKPPPSTIPPLWQRLQAAGVATEVVDWPGVWTQDAGVIEIDKDAPGASLEPELLSSLEVSLQPFPEQREPVLRALRTDRARTDLAVRALREGSSNLWLHLQSLATVREQLEPLRPLDTFEREVLHLQLDALDRQLGEILEAAGPSSLVAVVSPFGLAPPDPAERIRRLLGIGDDWRTSAESCPDGLLILLGENVAAGERFNGAELTDLAPTLCYLLGLPVAQYMDGRVISEAIAPSYLETHPLRVVD